MVNPHALLRWIYLGRLAVAAGIAAGALVALPGGAPLAAAAPLGLLLAAAAAAAASYAYTHLAGGRPGTLFLSTQAVFDTLLVTAAVHLTGGAESDFTPLYILVITAAALLLPPTGGLLVGLLAGTLYLADLVWLQPGPPPAGAFIQLALFATVALVTGYLGGRLRRAGSALGAARSELRRLRLETDDILRNLETGVVTLDAGGRLLYMNPAAEALLALSAQRWLGRPVLEELDRRAPGLATLVRTTAARREPIRREEVRVETAGATRILGARTTVLDRRGEPCVTAVFQDITDSRRLDDLHRQTERLQALAELAASLAHEIKNPLASIRSAVDQLTGQRLAPEDEQTLRRLVASESERLSRILSDFIEFTRIELRGARPVDLAATAAEAIALVARHPDAADGARIEFERPATPVRVHGDADLLHRAIFNLVLNAVQHAGPRGTVRVELGPAGPDLPPGAPRPSPVRLTVTDDGPGIPPEHLSRIFDPFFSTRQGGTGLGLALVHRAVQAHCGAIFVDAAPGQGARFTVYLPSNDHTPTTDDDAQDPPRR